MSLTKSKGNMYPWVTHTWSVLNGACPHACSYCYVQAMAKRFPAMRAKYTGPLRLDEKALATALGEDHVIFVEHLNDLWAESVPTKVVESVLTHCRDWDYNTFVFQTKNPDRYAMFRSLLPETRILGTTIETNWWCKDLSSAPAPLDRALAMRRLKDMGHETTFITVEPILDFEPEVMLGLLTEARPSFVNIGADSKGHGLPEPSKEKVLALIAGLQKAGIEIRQKHNLARLLS